MGRKYDATDAEMQTIASCARSVVKLRRLFHLRFLLGTIKGFASFFFFAGGLTLGSGLLRLGVNVVVGV